MTRIRGIAVATALLATITSTLSVYPHQLAYFNELASGPESGHKHLLGSNLDWGQDLLFLRESDSAIQQLFYVSFNRHFDPSFFGVEALPIELSRLKQEPCISCIYCGLSAGMAHGPTGDHSLYVASVNDVLAHDSAVTVPSRLCPPYSLVSWNAEAARPASQE